MGNRKGDRRLIKILVALLLFAVVYTHLPSLAAEKCEDIKGSKQMPGTHHDDNTPSESKFKKMVWGKSTICDVAFCYDNDECKGELDSGDYHKFKTTFVYEGASDKQQDCLDYRYHLPDDGERALQAYEIYDCGVGNY